MRFRVGLVVAVLLFTGACGDDSPSTAKSKSPAAPSASATSASEPFVVAPGQIGPVLAGMTLDEAKATGVLEPTKPNGDEPCPPPSLQWKAPNTDKLDLRDHDGKIAVMGVRDAKFKTAEGIGVDSTWSEVQTAYPGAKIEESPASGSLVYLKDANKWLAIAFFPQPQDLKDSSKVNYMEVEKDEKPIAYPDGC